MRQLIIRITVAVACFAAMGPRALAGPPCGSGDPNQDHDFRIGRDGTAARKLTILDEPGFCHLTGQPIELQPGDGLNDGYYVHQFPGWDATNGSPFPLMQGHELTLNRIASTNAGFDMLDPFLGIPILESDGSSFLFPWNGELEHEDVFYRVDAAFAQPGNTFTTTMQLTDPSGLQSASDVFTLHFVVTPEPAAAMLLALAALLLRRRICRG